MSEQNAVPTPPSNPSDPIAALDVVDQMIALCRRELEATAQSLAYASDQGDADRAAAAVLEIQAIALLHGLDDIAILARETEHAMELVADSAGTWKPVAQRLIEQCRPSTSQPDTHP